MAARSSRVVSDDTAYLAHEISDSTVTTDDGSSPDGSSPDGSSPDGSSTDGGFSYGGGNGYNKFTIN